MPWTFFKKLRWESSFSTLKTRAIDDLIQMHEEIQRNISQVKVPTRSLSELQNFHSAAGFVQKYNQLSRRPKIDEIARKPRDFVTPHRDPVLPSKTAPLAKDPTPEECQILWHIVDCESIEKHKTQYSVACPSEDLQRQKRVNDMTPNSQEKWMKDWHAQRDSLLSELDSLLQC